LGNLNGGNYLENLEVDDRIISNWILKERGLEGTEKLHLAQDSK
jgi:hypothetical protein